MNIMLRKIHLPPTRLMLATLVLAVASGVTLTSAYAAPPHGMAGGPMMGDGRHFDRMLDAVNATADQRTQVKAIMDSARSDTRSVHDSMKALHDQERTLFTQPTVDARAAETLRAQKMALHDQVSKRMLQAKLEVSRVLTPEQRKQLADRMAEMRPKMMGNRPPL
jgi:Spy/CpxP family protein refolding chaperone